MAPVEKLLRRWERRGVGYAPGVDEAALVAFEARHGVSLPADFRSYLQLANGTGDGGDDGGYWFASLDQLAPVAHTWGYAEDGRDCFAGCFVFADWALHCWDYAIQLAGPEHEVGCVFCVESAAHRAGAMAPSFGEWVTMYLRDPDGLVPGNGR